MLQIVIMVRSRKLERRSVLYHRAAAARARRLWAEATTRWLKDRLEAEIAQHEKLAANIERATKSDGKAELA